MRENLTPRRDLEAERDRLLAENAQLKADKDLLERQRRIAVQENQSLAFRLQQAQRRSA